jgi:branched-chain amino acid transport system substrate-binding protein
MRGRALAAAVLLMIACKPSADQVVVAAVGSWGSEYTRATGAAIEMALADINAAGGVLDLPFRVLMIDDSGSATKAVDIARHVVADGRIIGVVAPMLADVPEAMAIFNGQLPAVATNSSAPGTADIAPWTFHARPSDSIAGARLARAADELKLKRAVVLLESSVYGRRLAHAFVTSFGGVVSRVDTIRSDSAISSYIAAYKSVAPDLLFFAGRNRVHDVLREVHSQRLAATIMSGDISADVRADTSLSEMVITAVPLVGAAGMDDWSRFAMVFRTRYGYEPDVSAGIAYDAVRLIAEGVELSGIDRAKLRRHILALKELAPYAGVTGPISFASNGSPVARELRVVRVHRGAFEPLPQ